MVFTMLHRATSKAKIGEEELALYEARLRESGQFVTVQRRALLRYLLGNRRHPTTAQITRAVEKNRGASQATVYNNLALFESLDLIRAVRSPEREGEAYWDVRTDAHHHLSCTRCGSVCDIDLQCAEVRVTDRKLARRVERSSVWLTGVCESCDKKP
jgi:Fe2+ or Zn2+ uptake regulation protein